MLMSIKGISAEKAIEIQKHFPTMIELVQTLAGVDEKEGKLIVAATMFQVWKEEDWECFEREDL